MKQTKTWRLETKKLKEAGVQNCRHCHSQDNLFPEFRNNNHIYYTCRKCNTERARAYRKTEKGRANIYKAVAKSIQKYPERQAAREKVNNALISGKLVKPKRCEECDAKAKLQAHHWDYSKPFDVVWVCIDCHCVIEKITK